MKTQPTDAPTNHDGEGNAIDDRRSDQVVATFNTYEEADEARHMIVRTFQGSWVFVMKHGDVYEVSVSNVWDGRLPKETLAKIVLALSAKKTDDGKVVTTDE